MKTEFLKITELTPDERNAKIHTPAQIEHIKNSIEEFGFIDPIGVSGDKNIIVEGHGRFEAAKQLGFDVVPVIRLDHLTDNQRAEYGIVHNQLTISTGFDSEILAEELQKIDSIDMSQFGFGDLDEESFFDEGIERDPQKIAFYINPDGRAAELESLLAGNGYGFRIK